MSYGDFQTVVSGNTATVKRESGATRATDVTEIKGLLVDLNERLYEYGQWMGDMEEQLATLVACHVGDEICGQRSERKIDAALSMLDCQAVQLRKAIGARL